MRGVGIRRHKPVALNFESNAAFTVIVYDTLEVPFSETVGMTLMGRCIPDVDRYLYERERQEQMTKLSYFMSSNSPSGGMKLMIRSDSNSSSRTQG